MLIWPKTLLFRAVVGLPLRKLLVMLNASPRTSILLVSPSLNALDNAASNCHVVGPRTEAIPALPSEPGAGARNAAGFKYLNPSFR